MTTPTNADAKDLIALAERMGIPVDEAVRQVAQLIDVPSLIKLAPEPASEPETTVAVA